MHSPDQNSYRQKGVAKVVFNSGSTVSFAMRSKKGQSAIGGGSTRRYNDASEEEVDETQVATLKQIRMESTFEDLL